MSDNPTQRSPLGLIFLTLFIDMIGFGIVIPVLPLYAEGHLNASHWQMSWVVGIYSLFQFLFSPIWGKISDRIGRKPVLLVSLLTTVVGFITLGLAQSVTMLLIGRAIAGASGGNISTAMACVADVTTRENRSKAMGMVGAAFGLGFVIGPALGGILSAKVSISAPFYVAAGMALVNTLLVALRLPETLTPEVRARAREVASIGEVFSGHAGTMTALLGHQLAAVAGFSMMTSLFALYCEKRLNFNAAQVGYVLTYVGLLGAIIQGGLLRRLLKRPIEKPLAIGGTLLLAVSMALLPFSTTLGVLLVVCAGISIGNSFSAPTVNGLASRTTDAHCQGRLMGLLQSAASLGRFLGPMIAYPLAEKDALGSYGRTPFLASAAILLLSALLLSAVRAQAKPTPEEAQA